jgi:hypothetical protein
VNKDGSRTRKANGEKEYNVTDSTPSNKGRQLLDIPVKSSDVSGSNSRRSSVMDANSDSEQKSSKRFALLAAKAKDSNHEYHHSPSHQNNNVQHQQHQYSNNHQQNQKPLIPRIRHNSQIHSDYGVVLEPPTPPSYEDQEMKYIPSIYEERKPARLPPKQRSLFHSQTRPQSDPEEAYNRNHRHSDYEDDMDSVRSYPPDDNVRTSKSNKLSNKRLSHNKSKQSVVDNHLSNKKPKYEVRNSHPPIQKNVHSNNRQYEIREEVYEESESESSEEEGDYGDEESRLYYSRQPRPTLYRPHTLKEYKAINVPVKLGGLGPDLQNEKLLEKKATADRTRQYAKSISQVNSVKIKSTPKIVKKEPEKISKRQRAMEFASKINKPARQRHSRDLDTSSSPTSEMNSLEKLQQEHEKNKDWMENEFSEEYVL